MECGPTADDSPSVLSVLQAKRALMSFFMGGLSGTLSKSDECLEFLEQRVEAPKSRYDGLWRCFSRYLPFFFDAFLMGFAMFPSRKRLEQAPKRCQDVEYAADELVFQQGTARRAFLVVKSGEVVVEHGRRSGDVYSLGPGNAIVGVSEALSRRVAPLKRLVFGLGRGI